MSCSFKINILSREKYFQHIVHFPSICIRETSKHVILVYRAKNVGENIAWGTGTCGEKECGDVYEGVKR